MEKIRAIFERSIDRHIEEVIKVDQHDEDAVRQEIQEYVLTDAIKEHFYTLYDNIAKYQHEPHEGIGVWVSGFFGSGKSSFAKLMGYTLMNRSVLRKPASQWFVESARDERISSYLQNINSRYHIQSVIFDVSMDRGVRTGSDRITEVMYKVLLRELNYAEDLDLAELEITLEAEGDLEKFKKLYKDSFKKNWDKGKMVFAHALGEAGQILHKLYPEKYDSPETFFKVIGREGRADIDANKLARRTFDLVERRKPGYGIIYIVDEVGQYVSRSTDKMLDLQAVVQALGKESRNRVKRGKAKVPAWLIVTSQEKLEEVVDALDQRRIELARLQDRFPITIDLKQSDIQEVTAKRILLKKKAAERVLGNLFDKYEGQLKTHCTLERTHRQTSFNREEFIHLYPYLPYQIELSIDIVAGLRLKRGAQRHIGGSNRTIIKQAQQILIHPNINLAEQPLGALVTLDKIYDLLYGGSLLPLEISREVDNIPKHLPEDETALKAAKAISLMEVVRDLPRTAHNISVVLHPAVEADSLLKNVEEALQRLIDAQFVRETEEGFKLLSVQEKHWETERNSKSPKQRQKEDLLVDFFRNIFSEPSLRIYRYKGLLTFRIGMTMNKQKIEDGNVTFNFLSADNQTELKHLKDQVRRGSRNPEKENEVFWIFSLTEQIHQLLTQLFRSKMMIQEYGRLKGQQQISSEKNACLEDEQQREQRLNQKLKSLIIKAIETGSAMFRGMEKAGNLLGERLTEKIKKALDSWIPEIYPKLELGSRPMTGREAEQILTAANLKALPPVFYDERQGFNFIRKQGSKFLPNMNAPVILEIFGYLKREHEYGNKVTGKSLEQYFSGPPYGWERDLIRTALAVIFRANQLEINYQGQRYKSYQEPSARAPLTNQTAFRSATFSPKEGIDIRTLKRAAENLETLTGDFVDLEETALVAEFRKIAREDLAIIREVLLKIRQNQLPGEEILSDFQSELEDVVGSAPEDCIKMLAGEGKTYRENRELLRRLETQLTPSNIKILLFGQNVLQKIWPLLKGLHHDDELAERAQSLQETLLSESFYDRIESVRLDAEAIFEHYQAIYQRRHQKRSEVMSEVLEKIKGHPDFTALSDIEQNKIINPVRHRRCRHLLLEPDGICQNCHASLQQLESDILTEGKLLSMAMKTIHDLTTEPEKVVTIAVRNFLRGEYKSMDEINEAIDQLKDTLTKAFIEGKQVFIE